MPKPGVVIAIRRRDGIPASMKFPIGRSIIITPILVLSVSISRPHRIVLAVRGWRVFLQRVLFIWTVNKRDQRVARDLLMQVLGLTQSGGATVFHTKLIAQALRLLRVLVTVGVGGP